MDKKSLVYIIASGILWGTSGVFVKALSKFGLSTNDIVAFRTGIAAIVFLVVILLTDRKKLRVSMKLLIYYAVSGVSLFGTAAFYFAAITETSISTAVVLMYTAPIMVLVFSVVFMGEKLNSKKVVAVICTFIGCALVTGLIGNLLCTAKGFFFGLMSAVSFSCYNIVVRSEMKIKGSDTLAATTYCFVFAAIFALFFSNPARIYSAGCENTLVYLLWVFGLGIIPAAIPYLLYTVSLKKIPAGTASAMASIEPMTATLIGVSFYGEKLTVGAVIGIVLILSAIILLSFSEKQNNA